MARGDHAPELAQHVAQPVRSAQWTGAGHRRLTLGSWGTRRAAPAPAGEPRAGTHGRRVSKSRSSLFVDRTAAQQLMPSRPGRRHGRSSRARIA